jgi:hypothetical protein
MFVGPIPQALIPEITHPKRIYVVDRKARSNWEQGTTMPTSRLDFLHLAIKLAMLHGSPALR